MHRGKPMRRHKRMDGLEIGRLHTIGQGHKVIQSGSKEGFVGDLCSHFWTAGFQIVRQ